MAPNDLFMPNLNRGTGSISAFEGVYILRTVSRYNVLVVQSRLTPIALCIPPSDPTMRKAIGGFLALNNVTSIDCVSTKVNIYHIG